MLFQSQGFILIFLPLVLAAYYATARRPLLREWVLLAGSLVFYSWWDGASCRSCSAQSTATWGAVEALPSHRAPGLAVGRRRRQLRLACLFQVYGLPRRDRSPTLVGVKAPPISIVLPIGISFFTFQLACYLVDVARGDAHSYPWRRVTLFVSLFPHLIAGPIVRHHQIMPQLDADPLRPGLPERFAKGARVLHRRLRQEGVPRRSDGALRRSDLRGGRDLDAVARRRLARRARLLVPAVPRLLGLQRDGDRARSDAGRALSRQLRHALSRHRPREFLAALAHDAVAADPRLPLHPAGRQPARLGHLRESDAALHGPVRAVARGGLDLRGLGPDARGRASWCAGRGSATRSRCRRRSAGR